MQYRRITQEARIYEYGKGKMFETKKMALAEAENVKKELKDFCAKHKEKTDIKIFETDQNIQLLLYIYVPIKK